MQNKKNILKKFDYNSPVILTYALICVAVFFINWLSQGRLNRLLFTTYRSPLSLWAVLRSFLYIFGHQSAEHLTGNMTLFLLVGPIVEERYGSQKLCIMILSTAIATAVINNLLFTTGIIGASGIVFMLIILSSFTSASGDKIPITLVLVFAIYVGNEILTGVFSHDNVSQFGHIAGGVSGLVWGFSQKKSR